ncbi:hypothetical protein LOAG_03635 [Loa loa]|uniref:Uncharacterized protein n=1 Tax=Loa loa TaxID=7209 RepID=A0A1S0U4S5_LOALO|nr:hypothetical protein LOAG_03635 [Loa loa]EFO24856.1 hypothetical protein LOAG_03635 [Loa loa]
MPQTLSSTAPATEPLAVGFEVSFRDNRDSFTFARAIIHYRESGEDGSWEAADDQCHNVSWQKLSVLGFDELKLKDGVEDKETPKPLLIQLLRRLSMRSSGGTTKAG